MKPFHSLDPRVPVQPAFRPSSRLIAGVAAALVIFALAEPAVAQFQIVPSAWVLTSADNLTQVQSVQPESAEATALGVFRLRGQSRGYARASLPTGEMGVLARSVAGQFTSPGGSGMAQLEDEITFTGPAGAPPVVVDVQLRINGLIDLGPTSSGEGTTVGGSVLNVTRANLTLTANNGPAFGQSATGIVRHAVSGAFSAGPNAQLQTAWDLLLQETPYDSPYVGTPLGFVSFDTIRSNRFGLEEIITIPITVSPGDRFRLVASVETAAYSSESYLSYANFYDNSLLDLQLPPGYGFTSESGVLLSQSVPEPSAALLLTVGGLATAFRGRKRSVQPFARADADRKHRSPRGTDCWSDRAE